MMDICKNCMIFYDFFKLVPIHAEPYFPPHCYFALHKQSVSVCAHTRILVQNGITIYDERETK